MHAIVKCMPIYNGHANIDELNCVCMAVAKYI